MELKEYIHLLHKIPLFKSFTRKSLQEFFQTVNYRLTQYRKGSIIFIENETCNFLKIILVGVVQVQKIDSFGKILTIVDFHVGDSLGENLLFGDGNRFPMTEIAKTSTVLLRIPKEAVLHLCQQDKEFLIEFLRLISGKTYTLTGKLKQVTLKTIRQKICELLLEEYRKQGKLTINLKMSKKEWADRIGVQRPSLSRELIRMKEDGLIDYSRHDITIKNLEAMHEYL